MIASASAEIEIELSRLVALASAPGVDLYEHNSGGFTFTAIPNQVAKAALDALESMNARLSVVRAVLKVSVSKELCEEFEKIALSVRRAAGMRNDVVHCVWTIHPERPNDLLILTDTSGLYSLYTPKHFDAIIRRLNEEMRSIQDFRFKCVRDRSRPGTHIEGPEREA